MLGSFGKQTLSAISRSGDRRHDRKLAKQLTTVVPLVLKQCVPPSENADEEMIEACLQALESFVARCPKEVAPYQSDICHAALTYLTYDPNYADDEDHDAGMDVSILWAPPDRLGIAPRVSRLLWAKLTATRTAATIRMMTTCPGRSAAPQRRCCRPS